MRVTILVRESEAPYKFVSPVWDGKKLRPLTEGQSQFYLRYSRGGKQVTKPIGKDVREVSNFVKVVTATLLAEANGLAVSGGNVIAMPESAPDSSRTTIQEAVADYLTRCANSADLKRHTVTGYSHTLSQWLGWCRKTFLDEITRDDVWGFRTYIWKTAKQVNGKPYSERTANNKTENVVSFLNAVGRTGLMTEKDWQVMKPGPSKKIPYSKAEIAAMRGVADIDERDVIEFYPGLGLRKGEGYQTKWTDVDFANRYVRVGHSYTTKDKEPRNIQIGPALLERLKARRLRHPDTTFVFQNTLGGPDTHIDRVIARVIKKAGIGMAGKSITHSFRKTYATRLKNDAKTEIYKIMKLLGHSDIKTTEDYLGGYDPDTETVGEDIERALA